MECERMSGISLFLMTAATTTPNPIPNSAYPAQLNRILHTGTEPETTGIESIQKRRVTNQNEQINNTPAEAKPNTKKDQTKHYQQPLKSFFLCSVSVRVDGVHLLRVLPRVIE